MAVLEEVHLNKPTTFTDANWGSQDSLHPEPNNTRAVRLDGEMNSLQGHHTTQMGGDVAWEAVQELE